MPHKIVTRCGNRCDLCLIYKNNIDKEGSRKLLYRELCNQHGLVVEQGNPICYGCLEQMEAFILDPHCPIRKCVIDHGLENCAQCDDFICKKLESRLVSLSRIENKYGKVSSKSYRIYVKAFENEKRLKELRINYQKTGRMQNRHLIPDEAGMQRFIGGNKNQFWEQIIAIIESRYPLDKRIFYHENDQSWALQYLRCGKPVVTFLPERKSFTIIFTLGIIDLGRLKAYLNRLSPETKYTIENSPIMPEGESVSIKIDNDRHLLDARILADLKFQLPASRSEYT